MRIGVDLDGVVYDFTKQFEQAHLMRTGELIAQPTQWKFWDQPDIAIGLESFTETMRWATVARKLFWVGPQILGSFSALRRLYDIGHTIVLVTHREPAGAELQARWGTEFWLAQHQVPHHELVITRDKTVLGLDVLIDDGVHNLEASRDVGERAICFDQAWNREWNGERTHSWRHVLTLLGAAEPRQRHRT